MKKQRWWLVVLCAALLFPVLSSCTDATLEKRYTEWKDDTETVCIRIINSSSGDGYGYVADRDGNKQTVIFVWLSNFSRYDVLKVIDPLQQSKTDIRLMELDMKYDKAQNVLRLTNGSFPSAFSVEPPLNLYAHSVDETTVEPYEYEAEWTTTEQKLQFSSSVVKQGGYATVKGESGYRFYWMPEEGGFSIHRQADDASQPTSGNCVAYGTYTYGEDPLDLTLHFEKNELFEEDTLQLTGQAD